jgi:hypothetical protein
MNVDGKEYSQTIRVDPDPNLPPGQVMEEEEVEVEMGEDEEEEERREQIREMESTNGRWIDD